MRIKTYADVKVILDKVARIELLQVLFLLPVAASLTRIYPLTIQG